MIFLQLHRSHHVAVHVARKHADQQQPAVENQKDVEEEEEEDDDSHLEIVTTAVEAVGLYEEFPNLEAEELPVL